MSDLTAGLAAWGIAASRIHTETFGAGPLNYPGRRSVTADASRTCRPDLPATGPLVSFARSGLNVRWGAPFQSLLELAEACDVPVRWSCRTGVCHTCETGLVSRDGRLPTRPGRRTGRRQCADLLLCNLRSTSSIDL